MPPSARTKGGLLAMSAAVAFLSACSPVFAPITTSHEPAGKPMVKTSTSHATPKAVHSRRRPAPSPSPHPTASPTPTTSPTPTSTTSPTPTPTASDTPTPDATDAYEARILVLVNNERTSRGLTALTPSSCADQFAESWAPVIQRNGALSHQSLQPNLATCKVNTAGENVAYGNVTADQMMTMWMNSEGHRANILNPNFRAIGIAAVTDSTGRWYGVQDFVGAG